MGKKTETEQLADEQRAADAADKDIPAETVDESVEQEKPVEEEDRNTLGLRRNKNETREEIMAKAKANRNKRKANDTAQMDDEGRALQAAMEAEARGELHHLDSEYVEVDADGAPVEADTDEIKPESEKDSAGGVDTNTDLVTIKLDGQERQVPREDVEKAGVAALQKIATGDARIQAASQYEESVRNLEASVRQQFNDLQATLTAQAEVSTAKPPPGVLTDEQFEQEIEEKTEKVADALYSGDQDLVKSGLADLVKTSVAQGRSQSTPPLDANQVVQDVLGKVREATVEEEQNRAALEHREVAKSVNSTFETEFPDLYEDNRSFGFVKAEFDRLSEETPEADRVELMRQAAGNVQEILNPPENPVNDELAARAARKRRASADASSTAQRAPSKTVKRPPSRSETVAKMQQARGQRVGK